LFKVTKLVSQYQDIEHETVKDGKKKLSHGNIVKDFTYNIGQLISEGKMDKARELQDRFEQ
jgi:hypothetical protein